MNQLGYIELPYVYTFLLRSNMLEGRFLTNVKIAMREYPDFNTLVKMALADIVGTNRVDEVLSSLGWETLRNRIGALYLSKWESGEYPQRPDLKKVQLLLDWEKKFSDHCVEGYSRNFLLGFYLRGFNISGGDRDCEIDHFDEALFAAMKYSRIKLIRSDWVFLVLFGLSRLVGWDLVEDGLKSGIEYQDLYKKLSNEQRLSFSSDLLAYGSSIGETEIFYQNFV